MTAATASPAPTGGVPFAALADLARQTPADEIKSRKAFMKRDGRTIVQKNPDGTDRELDYVTARYVQDVLDDVCGPQNWQSKFEDTPGGVRCGIGILVGTGEEATWVWKFDVGTPSSIEPVKGAHSDAFKRAAVQWGIARDLYDERDEDHSPDKDEPERPISERTSRAASGGRSARYAPRTDEDERMHDRHEDDDDDDGESWVCPVHGLVKEVPAGVSKRTGRRYKAFLACPEPGCDETERTR